MSHPPRIRVTGAPRSYCAPTPAGEVQLETFLPWTVERRPPRPRKEVLLPPGAAVPTPDPTAEEAPVRASEDGALLRALGLAHHWQRLLDEGRVGAVDDIARAEGLGVTQVRRLLRLVLLAPAVIEALLRDPAHRLEGVLRRPWAANWGDQVARLDRIARPSSGGRGNAAVEACPAPVPARRVEA